MRVDFEVERVEGEEMGVWVGTWSLSSCSSFFSLNLKGIFPLLPFFFEEHIPLPAWYSAIIHHPWNDAMLYGGGVGVELGNGGVNLASLQTTRDIENKRNPTHDTNCRTNLPAITAITKTCSSCSSCFLQDTHPLCLQRDQPGGERHQWKSLNLELSLSPQYNTPHCAPAGAT